MPISSKDFALEFGLDPKTGEPIDNTPPKNVRQVMADPSTPRRMADNTSKALDIATAITGAPEVTPLLALTPKVRSYIKDMSPQAKRNVLMMALSIGGAEAAGAGAGAAGIESLLARYAMRGAGAAVGSALSDVMTGHKPSGERAAINAASELPGAAIEGAGKLVPQAAKAFARISEPVQDTARVAGRKFTEMFPGTSEAILAGAKKSSDVLNAIASATKKAREAVMGAAKSKIVSEHAADIQKMGADLEKAGQEAAPIMRKLKEARIARGIEADPHKAVLSAKMGDQGISNIEGLLPTEPRDLHARYNSFYNLEQKVLPPKQQLVEADRLKTAIQNAIGELKKQATPAAKQEIAYLADHADHLRETIRKLDPEFADLTDEFAKKVKPYDDLLAKHKDLFSKMRKGEEIPVPKEALKSVPKIKATKMERDFAGSTPEKMADKITSDMRSETFQSAANRRRMQSLPGYRSASGNVAAQDLGRVLSPRSLYRVAQVGSMGAGLTGLLGSKNPNLRGVSGLTALMGMTLPSPMFYRFLLTHPEAIQEMARVASTGVKALATTRDKDQD